MHRINVQVGDVVIVKDEDIPRNEWRLARVVEVREDDDGFVCKVKILRVIWERMVST